MKQKGRAGKTYRPPEKNAALAKKKKRELTGGQKKNVLCVFVNNIEGIRIKV